MKNNKKDEFQIKIEHYKDVLSNILGEFTVEEIDGERYLKTEDNKQYRIYPSKDKESDLCFCRTTEYTSQDFILTDFADEILVNEMKMTVHKGGVNVETIDRLYGISIFDKHKKALTDLTSHNYVIFTEDYSEPTDLLNRNFLQEASYLTTTFSAHMKHRVKPKRQLRSFVSTFYPSHVIFNNEDISYIYDYVDGIDKISKVYNLYDGNVTVDSDEIKMIITGLVSEEGFNYKQRMISKEVKNLIGESLEINNYAKTVEKYIEDKKEKPIREFARIERPKKEEPILPETVIQEETPKTKILSMFRNIFKRNNTN